MDSDRNEWLEMSWEKYWDNSDSELRDSCFKSKTKYVHFDSARQSQSEQ